MSYAPKRPKISKADRALVLARDNGCCYLCSLPIEGDDFDVDHEIARELGGTDAIENLRAAHKPCHRKKSKGDVKLIAKGNRLIRKHGPIEGRRKTAHPIRSRKAQWAKGQKIPTRKFEKRKL